MRATPSGSRRSRRTMSRHSSNSKHSVGLPSGTPTRWYSPSTSQPGPCCPPAARDSAITEPWKQRLKHLSPLTNRPATVHNFAGNVYRSRQWLDKHKGRSGALPVQSHDAHYAKDSHYLRSFADTKCPYATDTQVHLPQPALRLSGEYRARRRSGQLGGRRSVRRGGVWSLRCRQ